MNTFLAYPCLRGWARSNKIS